MRLKSNTTSNQVYHLGGKKSMQKELTRFVHKPLIFIYAT